ncbi:Intradiol ring-cleavage dioxygenase [Tricharina praecox]|uniref:Intradiol ring-cleavage dioxygenase n=1 Tax=Tricharina praecox TaxID=43433 RepID=UPI00221F5691|nr:Intradiol ring-cleavage dioxygenase [Tricharina praecox]KAI5858847.1 Intradiol ring-cleavage dioxygenase [Tricharina praecox]
MAKRAVHSLKARNSLAKCSEKLKSRDFVEHRMARRAELIESHFEKRTLETRQWQNRPPPQAPGNTSEPCILTPEVTVGPYYVSDELIRPDISEGQDGIDLLLDFQLIDVNTCLPVPRAMIDVWHCNTTGSYSGFAQENTAELSFNRGLQPTDRNGIMHMKTSFPGWYQGRATHIHIAAHINGKVNRETHTYEGGITNHVGQVFFPEDTLTAVETVAPYNTNEVIRLRNAEDGIFVEENTGYNAVSEIQFLGRSIEDGVLAFISIGIDISANHTDALLGGAGGPGGPGGPPNGTFPSNGTFPGGNGTTLPV